MTIKYSTTLRNALLDGIESGIGSSAKMYIRTGAAPANTTDADSGSLLATLNLPTDWMAAAASGQKAKAGTWQATASASGTAGHFRIKGADGLVTFIQGTVGTSAADLIVDSTTFTSGQAFTITSFTITAGQA